MTAVNEPFADPSTSIEEIFRSTYLVLRDSGYAGVSIQRIADRTSLSKSTLYYHFDDKYDLLMQFSEEFLSWYLERLVEEYEGDAQETLSRLLDIVLLGEADDGVLFEDVFAPGYIATILEMRAQAVRDQEMRTYVTVTDEVMRDHLVALIEDGIEDGTFIDVDPEATASVLFVFFEGGLLLRSCEEDTEWMAAVRDAADAYLEEIKQHE
ncbi:TetR/AcrR family transcriptional regulator [Natrialba swarupiae]|nr:TetR/AcrR family transcriptional regulator [Natrialba swarupiae]